MNKKYLLLVFSLIVVVAAQSQTAEDLIRKVKAKLDKVNDYEAKGKMKTNVVFIKVPVASVKIYFKKPNKMRINNEKGISFVPKGSVNINLSNILAGDEGNYDIVDAGKDGKDSLRIIKLLPKDDNADIVLSTLYIDESKSLIRKAKTTTKDNGTYELEMTYGRYSDYGLADKVIFSFNTKDYKMPKGVTFDYDDGTKKDKKSEEMKNKKGKVEISYSEYIINKGVSDSVFQ